MYRHQRLETAYVRVALQSIDPQVSSRVAKDFCCLEYRAGRQESPTQVLLHWHDLVRLTLQDVRAFEGLAQRLPPEDLRKLCSFLKQTGKQYAKNNVRPVGETSEQSLRALYRTFMIKMSESVSPEKVLGDACFVYEIGGTSELEKFIFK